ncbi:family 16 glycosylhydrolase [Algisphaera agarilytica]|uniref:Beta-glucanase (GH16 family) n=1 Tax=Algisphaera agarilytica TaxID=1385975 RepID=A0A7X0H5K3_9BACT|nr:family 16 glycosylhydrolase [Algisphaera agarilytica]MBB6429472.1 beta-glucanase (GH16 family) [Algisphaera agarilytica]
MPRICSLVSALLLTYFITGCTATPADTSAAVIPPPPVDPPAGYQWVLNEPLSDEFNGTELDRDKWLDHYPGWEGRVPGLFVPESISVKDGTLKIRSHILDEPRGDEGQWTIGCGAIQSKAMTAHYGYFEARIKTSNVRTSTTFWMKNDRGPKPERPFKITELDVMEAVGNAGRWPGFATQIKSNTHIEYFAEDPDSEPVNLKKGGGANLPDGGRSHDRFRTYACWWVDANTIHFYVDGQLMYTVEPSTELDPSPMDLPMFINAVCEIYTWELPPEEANLRDDSRNTSYYDFIRSWTLEKIED